MLLEFDRPEVFAKRLTVCRQVLNRGGLTEPGGDIIGIRHSGTESNEADVSAYGLHAGHHCFETSTSALLEYVYFVNQKELDKLHELDVVLPFARHTIPFLGCRDDDAGILNVA